MINERVLSLDVSSKTGYALLLINENEEFKLEAYGKINKVECPEDEPFPGSYVTWAYKIFSHIEALIETHQPDVLVIEQTCAGSKNAFSQKILEFAHFLLYKYIQETGIKSVFMLTGEWRKIVGSYMNAEEKNRNKEIKAYKKKHGTKLARDAKTGKVIGKVGKKQVTIRLINDIFKDQLIRPLKTTEDDIADAASLSYAYFLKKKKERL